MPVVSPDPHGQEDPDTPTADGMMCPECGRGPWRSVTKHAARKHGIPADTLKARLGVPKSRGLSAPGVERAQREATRARGRPEALIQAGRGAARSAGVSAVGAANRAAVGRVNLAAVADRRRRIPLDAAPAIQRRVDAGERLADIGRSYGVTASAVCRFMAARRPSRLSP